MVMDKQKLQELADLLKTRPKNDVSKVGSKNWYLFKDYEEWFEHYDKKFVELFGVKF